MNSSKPPFEVLLEDNHCLAVSKPAGLLTMGDRSGDASLHSLACDYLKHKYAKPGAVFLGVVHRLDRTVSGVVLLARTSKAAARLSEQFRERTVRKIYWAMVEGRPPQREGVLRDRLAKDRIRNISRIVDDDESTNSDAVDAELRYTVLRSGRTDSLVEVELMTGRSHQIRVQLAAAGCPIAGDVKYGGRPNARRRLALHARELTFLHPISREATTVTAELPPYWA